MTVRQSGARCLHKPDRQAQGNARPSLARQAYVRFSVSRERNWLGAMPTALGGHASTGSKIMPTQSRVATAEIIYFRGSRLTVTLPRARTCILNSHPLNSAIPTKGI